MENNQGNVFINGKSQMIELLQHLNTDEKERILKNIKIKNPTLADELTSKSFTFQDIGRLSDDALRQAIQFTNPQIMGLSLKLTPIDFQRKILRLANRDYAEAAFKSMNATIANPGRDAKRAQEKILGTISDLIKKKIISWQ